MIVLLFCGLLFVLLLVIIVLLSIQLHLTKKLLKNKGQNEAVAAEEQKKPLPDDKGEKVSGDKGVEEPIKPEKIEGEDNPPAPEDNPPIPEDNPPIIIHIETPSNPIDTSPASEEEKKSNKEKVLEAIAKRNNKLFEEDLPLLEADLSRYFSKNSTIDYIQNLDSKDYYRFIDLRSNPTTRVVVVGDIHCDFPSLAAVLLKLSVSDYDYFDKAFFVFLGDYLDRGENLFEHLLLLMDLKEILGDRMIMLKGNHETVGWDEENKVLKARVKPHESTDCMNEFCGKNKKFLKDFAQFYNTLPIYVYLKTNERNVLLTHASIPRDVFIDAIKFDSSNGAMVFSPGIPAKEQLLKRNQVFKDMIWGDPSAYEEKIQYEGRFQFGRKQFEQWTLRNNIGLMFRSHEETAFGYKSFYDDRLFTVFSTGGKDNDKTGYDRVEPAFAVIKNDGFFIENSYIYKIRKEDGWSFINLFSKLKYTDKQIVSYKLEDEFACDSPTGRSVREVFKAIQGDKNDDSQEV